MSTRAGTGQDGRAVDLARVETELLARWPETRLQPSLARISALVDLLGSPHRAMPVVQVAGTNGKTTTARMVDELLRGFGLRVGRFTSPPLQSIRERIVLDGEPVGAERFVETYDDIAPYVQMVDAAGDVPMSFFEVMVGMAYALFADAPVDVAVIEVGMGGTWDATNVADARVAVVTPVAMDHAEYLGPDVGTIAGEKAGIIKRDAIAVLARQEPAALDALVRRVVEVEATLAREGTEFGVLERKGPVGRAGGEGARRRPAAAVAGPGRRVRGAVPAAVRRAPGAERGHRARRRRGVPRRRRGDRPDRPGDCARRVRRRQLARPAGAGAHLAHRAGRRRAQPRRDGRHGGRHPRVVRLHPAGRGGRRRARQGRRGGAARAGGRLRRAGGHPERLAAGDARRRAGRAGRRRLRRRPGQRVTPAARGPDRGDRARRGGSGRRPGRLGRARHRQAPHPRRGPPPARPGAT